MMMDNPIIVVIAILAKTVIVRNQQIKELYISTHLLLHRASEISEHSLRGY
jgi:hypothetical protein